MEKKVVLLTGASGGLGSSLARLLASDVELVLHHHTNELADDIKTLGHCISADLQHQEEIEQMINQIVKRFGRIDVLINNAGVSESAMSWKTSDENWRKTLSVNLDAPFFLSKAVTPVMRANKFGRIINISSVVAVSGVMGTSAYAASKAGLIGLTKNLAKELAGFGITCNALALGYFDRGMINDVPDEQQQQIIENIPLKRLGKPSEIAHALRWLMDEEAGYVTGQTVHLNGGLFG